MSKTVNKLNLTRRLLASHSFCLHEFGWYVEYCGKRVAVLAPGQHMGDGWYRFRLKTLGNDSRPPIEDGVFWDKNMPQIILRSRLNKCIGSHWRRGGFHEDGGAIYVTLNAMCIQRQKLNFCEYIWIFPKFRKQHKEHWTKTAQIYR